MPKVLVTAGTDGVGKVISDYFSPESLGLGRRSNHDIRDSKIRSEISELSLEYDIFVNHAYSRDLSQVEMLTTVFNLWKKKEKKGYIFSTGTYGTYRDVGLNPYYLEHKEALDKTHTSLCQEVECGQVPFRMTLLRPGMLDTERSRQKPHWRGNGVRGLDIARIIECFYSLPSDLLINDIVIESVVSNEKHL